MGQGELTSLLQREVKSVDPNLPVFGVRSMDEIVASSLGQRRFAVQLLSAFSVLALVLSAVGIYGVMAYSVAQRRRELCVRLALGARPLDIRRLVLNQGVRLAAMGLVIGLIGGAVATQAMRSLLFSVSPHDPTSFAGIALLLSGVAVVSSYLPARRAAAYNPTMALRD
jgi:ABC-type antimicrobial peptide transport system permease subunit